MFASPTPLKVAPALRARRPGLRLHVKPDAFGNALGNSLAQQLAALRSVQAQQDYEEYLKDQAGKAIWAPRAEDPPAGTGLRPGGGVGLKWGDYRAGQAPEANSAWSEVIAPYDSAGLEPLRYENGEPVLLAANGGGRPSWKAFLEQANARRQALAFDRFRQSEIAAGNALARREQEQTAALLPGAKQTYILLNQSNEVMGPQGNMSRELFGQLLSHNPRATLEVLGADAGGFGLSVQLRQPALERDYVADSYAGERRRSLTVGNRAYSPIEAYTPPIAANPWTRGVASALDDLPTQTFLQAEAYANQRNLEIGLSLTGLAALPFRVSSGVERLWGLGATTEFRLGGNTIAESAAITNNASKTAIQTYWPSNGGFFKTPVPETLGEGYRFSRYGGFFDESGTFKDFGSFVAPENVPYGMRALPPGTNMKPLSTYEVVKPIPEVPSGPSAPYFGELGLGKQHQLPMTIQDYLDQGYIRLINRSVPKNP